MIRKQIVLRYLKPVKRRACSWSAPAVRVPSGTEEANRSRPAELEKLVHELISDRLLMLSRYITLDSASRTILIDRTSLETDGYQIVSH